MPLPRFQPSASAARPIHILLSLGLAAPLAANPATHRVVGEVVDADTGAPLPCRLYIEGADHSWHFAQSASPEGSVVEYRKQKDWNPRCVEMHTTLSAHPFAASLPDGSYEILVERGKEYFPERRPLRVEGAEVRLRIPLRRWIDMAERGWYSGDTHVHRPLSELPNVQLAEDLNVTFPLTSWVTEAFVSPLKGRPNADRDSGADAKLIDRTHVIFPRNTEYEIFTVGGKSHTLGAFFVLGHQSLFDEGVPPVRPVGRRARAENALLELDKHNWPWSMMLVPILRVDLFELSNNHVWRTEFGYRDYGVAAAEYMGVERDEKGWTERGWIDFGFQNYYALLDCGFRLRPTAGTASGVHPVPLGFGRVYVHLEGGFSHDAWRRGLDEGRSFVTTGPMLFVQVNGKDPGHRFQCDDTAPRTYHLSGKVRSANPLQPIEVVVNGEVARRLSPPQHEIPGRGYECEVDEKFTLDHSSWVAVRCFEDRADRRVRFAHTAPIFIDVAGRPLRPRRVEVEYLMRCVQTEIDRHRDVLPAPALEEYREALRTYEEIATRAR